MSRVRGILMQQARLVIAILILMATITGSVYGSDPCSPSPRYTFTWISKVTPELAKWAKDLCFTDVVCSDSSNESYQNLANEGIEYWYAVTAYAIDFSDVSTLKEQIDDLTALSPNGNVYLDDIHILLENYDLTTSAEFFNAVRGRNNTILDGFTYDNLEIYGQLNLTGIEFDAYQPITVPYQSTIEVLEPSRASLGIYIWAWYGFPWVRMTQDILQYVYDLADSCNLTRVVVWGGYSDEFYECCLYNYPQWWDTIRLENKRFLK